MAKFPETVDRTSHGKESHKEDSECNGEESV